MLPRRRHGFGDPDRTTPLKKMPDKNRNVKFHNSFPHNSLRQNTLGKHDSPGGWFRLCALPSDYIAPALPKR